MSSVPSLLSCPRESFFTLKSHRSGRGGRRVILVGLPKKQKNARKMEEVVASTLRRYPQLLRTAELSLELDRKFEAKEDESTAVIADERLGGLRTVARRRMEASERIFAERAVMSFRAFDSKVVSALGEAWRSSFGDPVDAARQISAFCEADAETRRAVLELYCPPEETLANIDDLRDACARVAELVGDVTAADLCRFLRVADVNRTGDQIFLKLSRLQHSCAPNVFIRGDETVIELYALRAIDEGQDLTFAYQGYSSVLMLPTPLRRKALGVLGFQCQCTRCSSAEEIMTPEDSSLLALAALRYCCVDHGFPPRGSLDLHAAWPLFQQCRRSHGPSHWTVALLCFALLDAFAVPISVVVYIWSRESSIVTGPRRKSNNNNGLLHRGPAAPGSRRRTRLRRPRLVRPQHARLCPPRSRTLPRALLRQETDAPPSPGRRLSDSLIPP